MRLLLLAAPLLAGAMIPPPLPIHLNRLGFEPGDAKIAIVHGWDVPYDWKLVDAAGKTLLSGKAVLYGKDEASGASNLQRVDFSAYRGEGEGYRLIVAGAPSEPFAIRRNLYAPLARDALAFFYHQRAGVPIEARFVGQKWARPAGHARELAKCFTGKDERGTEWPACGYARDVRGGWYDAGDHGKYVVNGGISLWTLLNAYERRPNAFPDKSLKIPEAGNGASDLLDEARYEMEWMLRMQLPEGQHVRVPVGPFKPLAPGQNPWTAAPADFVEIDAGGMALQKVADRNWTKLPMPPQDDPEERLLYPPTTAATLNLAAVAAQCARLWKNVDDAFAARCLGAAKSAWGAAKRNPEVLATNSFTGSGGYGDRDVSDEFYWAAAELLVTTGADEFAQVVQHSRHFHEDVREPSWPGTAALGTMLLATRPASLPAAEVKRLQSAVIAAADRFLNDAGGNGYAIPYIARDYPWGSNSSLLNRAMILATAHDLSGDAKYRAGVIAALDYVLGRNPMNVSYVSGYGARSMQNPHHRFWAHSLDKKLPGPPPGVLSGGPNSTNMSDDIAKAMKGRCAPQMCWADDIHAFALNEVAINWNAPLFWVAAWADSD
ncbi:MAG: glycoside hydrolase family 9 protein [Sphingomonas sp.]|uniref:glycoside hydrolase family 9 protein n=1 Tax=Sphingomonas sp. TaxID=28214 RepID=UPI0025DBD910|nr:glycoside hydrolase family 9 protein [Sphingomonas sp.]MBX3564061.1 glycoside hydrolase family 9 protein [Sphingomonas sp.]